MPKVFLSYRRDDTASACRVLYDALVRRFGADAVFKDVDTIGPGEDFIKQIGQCLAECDVVLILIGPRWLSLRNRSGLPRIHDNQDTVAWEVKTALESGKPVLPLLIDGAIMPSQRQLPEAISDLSHLNAVPFNATPLRPIADADQDMRRIVRWIEQASGHASFVSRLRIAIGDALRSTHRQHANEAQSNSLLGHPLRGKADSQLLPFSSIAVPSDQYGAGARLDSVRKHPTSGARIGVPVGLCGGRESTDTSNELQYLIMTEGECTSVIGSPGQGKSDLLQAILLNLTLLYSPQELEIRLIDMNPVSVFTPYTDGRLPHITAAVAGGPRDAITRQANSILWALIPELDRRVRVAEQRGFAHRYFGSAGGEPFLLVIVNECEELLASDSEVRGAALYVLERYIRLSRALGGHLLLGFHSPLTSTPSAYELLGITGVRIAFSCSADDARRLFSEPRAVSLLAPYEALCLEPWFDSWQLFRMPQVTAADRDHYLGRLQTLPHIKPSRA